MNIYDQYLEHIRNKHYDASESLEFHHEPPKYTKKWSDDSPHNVYASFEDHKMLHYYRFLAYRRPQDYVAWMYRVDSSIAATEAGRMGGRTSFKRKSGWFSQDPSEKGRKGGVTTGKLHNEHRQSEEYGVLVRSNFEWSFHGTPALCTFNCTNGRQIFEEITKYPEYQIPYTRGMVCSINRALKVGCAIKGMRPRLIDMGISSEASGTPEERSETT
jgi:general stress protein YciG